MTTPVYLDLTQLETKSAQRGIGRYVRGLVSGLAEIGFGEDRGLRVVGFTSNQAATRLVELSDIMEYTSRPARVARPVPSFQRNWLVGLALGTLRASEDALIHLCSPSGIPWRDPSRRNTLTCLDVITLALPELYLPPLPKWERVHAAVERRKYGRPGRILAISHATRKDLLERVEIPADRVEVAWLGVDHHRFQPSPDATDEAVPAAVGTTAPYVLYLGAGDARKDLDTLVTAFGRSRARTEGHLVIAGNLGEPRTAALGALRARLGLEDVVHLTGYLPESLVPALYRQSRVHVFPSRYEGFGLPVVEALACGTPTVTSPGSSLGEVAGDAASLVACGDPESLARAIDGLWFDEPRRELARSRGIGQASRFTWRKCAEETVEFWKRSLA